MTRNAKVLLVGSLVLLLVSWRPELIFGALALVFGQPESDFSIVVGLVGGVSFVACLLLDPPPSNNQSLLLPLLFALSFSVVPILSEFDPHQTSKGWGILIAGVAFFISVVGSAAGLAAGRFLRKRKAQHGG